MGANAPTPTIETRAIVAPGTKRPVDIHEHLASTMEAALGRAMPRMEIRFRDLAIAADVVQASSSNNNNSENHSAKPELPTLPNVLVRAVKGLAAKKSVVHHQILHGISGVFRPGTMTLVLGQPGSGKSSLLKVLSGRFPRSKAVTIDGEITYNGKPQHEMTAHLAQFVAYVTQHDRHFGTLTVQETFEFAHQFSGTALPKHTAEMLRNGTPEQVAAAEKAVRELFQHYPEIVINQLGLDSCKDTPIGDEMTRGVSGGQRKRVTLGEMEFGLKYVSLMDEISTGLDSAATYDIVKTQRSVADKFKKTIVMSLLQPAPEVFELFDDVILLNEGHVMYYGPRAEAKSYFEALGFTCPAYRDTADFLMDLGTSQQTQYEMKNWHRPIPRSPMDFGDAYKYSSARSGILAQLDEPVDAGLLRDARVLIDPMPAFQQSYWANGLTMFRRQLLIAGRDRPFQIGRTVMIVIMGLLYSSVFYQFDVRDIQVVLGAIFLMVLFVTLGQVAQLPKMMAEREIFYKQRGANFVRSTAYAFSFVLSEIPAAIAETLVFGSLLYWMCGFADSPGAFVKFEVVLFLTSVCFTSWFFFLSALTPNINVLQPVALVSVLFFVLFSGFAIFKSQIPDYLIWVYWIDPQAWSLRALAVNEYRSGGYDVDVFKGLDYRAAYGKTMGEYYLSVYDVPTDTAWVYYGMIFLAAASVLLVGLAAMLLEHRRHESPENPGAFKAREIASANDFALLESPRSHNDQGTNHSVDIVSTHAHTFVPVTLAFKDLRYAVPDPSNDKAQLELLKGISGFARPGSMTALMGASGAGKTTLMDVIAGRKTGGTISGSILVNGHPATDHVIRRATGYCEQTDVHLESATFREAVTFSAFLRQSSSVSDAQKFDSVQECLELLDMTHIADRVVRGSSMEQRKRLTIGVELAAQPSVLFLDEPTSGLDARSAKIIMDGVRKVADSGRTIVCTIHQPSAEVFDLFDSLLLLKKGGETVFFGDLGDSSRNLISYFEAMPSVKPLPVGYNPATWMLECIGAGVSNEVAPDVDFVGRFQASPLHADLQHQLDRGGVGKPHPQLDELVFADKRAATAGTQFRFLLRRSFALYWRTASYNLTRIGISISIALLFWLVFGRVEYTSYQGINSGVAMIFLSTIFSGLVSSNSVMPLAIEERGVFYRETASHTYSTLWYFAASSIVEIPYSFVTGLVFTVIFFPALGFEGFSTGVYFWLTISLLILMQTYFGQLLAYVFPTMEVGAVVGMLLNNIFFLFMGNMPPSKYLPSAYDFLFYGTPQRYPFAILTALVFGDCGDDSAKAKLVGCKPLTNTPPEIGNVTVRGFVDAVYAIRHEDIANHLAVMLGCIVLFRLLALAALRFINHTKR